MTLEIRDSKTSSCRYLVAYCIGHIEVYRILESGLERVKTFQNVTELHQITRKVMGLDFDSFKFIITGDFKCN